MTTFAKQATYRIDNDGHIERRTGEMPGLMKSPQLLPKMTRAGSLHIEFKRCGRPSCRCVRGLLHGPYIYRHWLKHGRQKKTYVPMAALTEMLEVIERKKAEAPNIAEVLLSLREPRHE